MLLKGKKWKKKSVSYSYEYTATEAAERERSPKRRVKEKIKKITDIRQLLIQSSNHLLFHFLYKKFDYKSIFNRLGKVSFIFPPLFFVQSYFCFSSLLSSNN